MKGGDWRPEAGVPVAEASEIIRGGALYDLQPDQGWTKGSRCDHRRRGPRLIIGMPGSYPLF